MGSSNSDKSFPRRAHTVLVQVSLSYSVELGRFPCITHPSAAPHKGALDLHVLSLPPAFVLSQDQTLMFRDLILALWSRLNRREHSHPPDQQNQPDDCNFLSKRDPPKSRTDPIPRRVPDPASLCRPRFSFFSIFNCQRSDVTDATSGPSAWSAPGPVECRSRGSL